MDDKQFNILMHAVLGIQSAILSAELHRLTEGEDDEEYREMLLGVMSNVVSRGLGIEHNMKVKKEDLQ